MLDRPILPLTLSRLAALLMLGLAIAGIAQPDLYQPMTPEHLMPGTMSQDAISIVAAIAVLVLTRELAHNTSPRLWLIWLGLQGYCAYAYGLYVFETVINPLYLGYIATLGLALWSIITFFACADLTRVRPGTAPRRITAALFALLAVMFLALWLSILLPALQSRSAPDGSTIFAFDLSFVLPALAITAWFLWRHAPWGDILALPLLIKATSLGLSVLIGTLIAPLWGLPLSSGELVIYAVLTLFPAALVPLWWRAFDG